MKINRRDFLKAGMAAGAVAAGTTAGVSSGAAGVPKWGFIVDLDRCIGCKACAIACKAEFDTRLGVFRSQVMYFEHGKYPEAKNDFLPWLCNHCENPPCVPVCPVEPIEDMFMGVKFEKRATYVRPDGAVLVDQDRCIGCGLCLQNCPYRVRFFDPGRRSGGNPELPPAAKCDYCVHRLDAGVVPSCVNTCQARARIIGDLNDPGSEVSRILKEKKSAVLLPEQGTKPKIHYIGKNSERINEALRKGEDLREEANTKYQLGEWGKGPYA